MTTFEDIRKKFEEKKQAMSDGMGEVCVFDASTGGAVLRVKGDPDLKLAKVERDEKRDADLVTSVGVLVENLPEDQLSRIASGLGSEGVSHDLFLPQMDDESDQDGDERDQVNPFLIPIDLVDDEVE